MEFLKADQRWVDGYAVTDSIGPSSFISGTPDYALPPTYDPDNNNDPPLPEQIICHVDAQARVYNRGDLSQNAGLVPQSPGDMAWGPMFQIQIVYADTTVTSPAAPVGCFSHGHLRSDCLHFTADPEGGNVTDVRKLQSLITMAPEFRVGINKQFPEARLHVGGDIEAEGLGERVKNVLYRTIEREFAQEGLLVDGLGNRVLELVTETLNGPVARMIRDAEAKGTRAARDLTNRALELVTEEMNRGRREDRDLADMRAQDRVNRALELVTETLEKKNASGEQQTQQEQEEARILFHIRFAMATMSDTLRHQVYTKDETWSAEQTERAIFRHIRFAMATMSDVLRQQVYTKDEIDAKLTG